MRNQIFSYDNTQACMKLLSSEPDGSRANKQARNKAVSYLYDLLTAFSKFQGFEGLEKIKDDIRAAIEKELGINNSQ